MKKWAFLIVFTVFLVSFQSKTAHAQGGIPCGSYGLDPSAPCVPNTDSLCQEWLYDSNGDVVPGSEQCTPAVPQGGTKYYTNDIGQDCQQSVDADGNPTNPPNCFWETTQKSVSAHCYELIYTDGPAKGESVPGTVQCLQPSSPPTEYLKTWVEP